MNNKVFIMLALLLICCVGLLSIKKPIKTERFENNIRNKNPREHKHPDDISAAVEKLNKEINSLENTNPDVKPIDLNKIKPKETKPEKNTGFCIDKPKPKEKKDAKKESKRLSHLTQKLNATTIDMSKYILKSRVSPQPNMSKYMLKSEIPTCPKNPDLSDYILKTKIPVCTKPKPKKKSKKKKKPKSPPKPKPKPKSKPDKKMYVVRKLSPPKKEKSPTKCTKYIPRMPINLTRNQPPKKCKIIRRVIKHGDLYGAY
tara:strand:+ start:4117 stop:4890 length:774 start_codon:yes stop_codon:yes gene_type:complete